MRLPIVILLTSILGNSYGQAHSNSTELVKNELTRIKTQLNRTTGDYYFDKNGISEKVIYIGEYKITYSSENSMENMFSYNTCSLSISKTNYEFTDKIDFKTSVIITSLNADIDIFENKAYICWVSENSDEKEPSKIWLKIVDLPSKKVEYFENIYTQKWGINRISIIYNPINESLHFAYNDFSMPDASYLCLGSLAAKGGKPSASLFQSKSILNIDQSEKRHPKFIRTTGNVFLYHTSGDTWRFSKHEGIQGLGISKIDKDNAPSDYRTLNTSIPLTERILITNDSVFYEEKKGVDIANFPLKKIALKDLPLKE